MPCKGVAVMKRRSDGWLNATQVGARYIMLLHTVVLCQEIHMLIFNLKLHDVNLADPQSSWIR